MTNDKPVEGATALDAEMRTLRPTSSVDGGKGLKPRYDNSWAVVIGINNYVSEIGSLKYPVKDADGFARLLVEDLGFRKENVFVILDPPPADNDMPYTLYAPRATRDTIRTLLVDELPQKIGRDDRLVIFFAGHGGRRRLAVEGENYRGFLIPGDAQSEKWSSFIDMDDFIKYSELYEAKHIFYLIDCCYSGLALKHRDIKQLPPYAETMLTKRARMVLTAGTADQAVNDGGEGGHSPFTWHVIQGLKGGAEQPLTKAITASDLAYYVKTQLRQQYGETQLPEDAKVLDHEYGADFIFRMPMTRPLPTVSTPESIIPVIESIADPGQLLILYYQSLVRECNSLKIENICSGPESAIAYEPPRLEQVYTDLKVIDRSDEEIARRQSWAEPLASGDDSNGIRAMDIVIKAQHRLVVFLGEAGSGKSTLLNYLTLSLAPGNKLVIRLQMREVAHIVASSQEESSDFQLLWEALKKDITYRLGEIAALHLLPLFQQRLMKEGAVILLDGLDEVSDASNLRRTILQNIKSLADKTPENTSVVVTSRPSAYADIKGCLPGFSMFTLAPFGYWQVSNFIDLWYSAIKTPAKQMSDEDQAKPYQLKLTLEERKDDLAHLAANPLLLTLMIVLDSAGYRLQQERVKLYDDAIDLMINGWQRNTPRRLSNSDQDGEASQAGVLPAAKENLIRSALAELAFTIQARQWKLSSQKIVTAEISLGDVLAAFKSILDQGIGPSTLMNFLVNGSCLLREILGGQNTYQFFDRSFQEYLSGCHIVSQDDYAGLLHQLASDDAAWWREAILFGLGKIQQKSPVVALGVVGLMLPEDPDEVLEKHENSWRLALLAGRALQRLQLSKKVESQPYERKIVRRIQNWLVELIRGGYISAMERWQAGDVLGSLGDIRFRTDAWNLPDEPDLGFIKIPNGKFWMGTRDEPEWIRTLLEKYSGNPSYEVPGQEYMLGDYYISRYPVTVAQFRVFIEETGRTLRNKLSLYGKPNHPVVSITWEEADAYCQWLTQKLKDWPGTPEPLAILLRGDHSDQLSWQIVCPSEPEWEKAARGDVDDREFPWGDEPDTECANYWDTGIPGTSAVGCFPRGASRYGCLDMSGNVWEWTRSIHTKYPYPIAQSERAQLETLETQGVLHRALRGGAFYNWPGLVRCAARVRGVPYRFDQDTGFRIALCYVSRNHAD